MNKLVNVHLAGDLGKTFGQNWNLSIQSVAECMRALAVATNEKIYHYLIEKDKVNVRYRVLINKRDFLTPKPLHPNDLQGVLNSELVAKNKNLKTIDIIPIIQGADDSGLLTTITGGLLVVAGLFLTATGNPFGPTLVLTGLGLLAAGVTALLTKPPKIDQFEAEELDGSKRSYLLSGPVNATREGNPVPVGYGRLLVGSQVVSASYVVKNISADAIEVTDFFPGTLDSIFGNGEVNDVNEPGVQPALGFNPAFVDIDNFDRGLIAAPLIYGARRVISGGGSFRTFRLNLNGKETGSSSFGFRNVPTDTRRVVFNYFGPDLHIVVGGSDGAGFIRINDNSSRITPNNVVHDILPEDEGNFLIIGAFTTLRDRFGTVVRNGIARIDKDGIIHRNNNEDLPDWGWRGVDGISGGQARIVTAIKQPDGKILIGGHFTTVEGSTRNNVARLNSDGSFDSSLPDLQVVGLVLSLAVESNGDILIGGYVSSVLGSARSKLARVSSVGILDAFNPIFSNGNDDFVHALAVQEADDKIWVGGGFSTVNNASYSNLVRLNDIDGSVDGNFFPGSGPNRAVSYIKVLEDHGGKVIIAGRFTSYNGISRRAGIAKLNNGNYPDPD